MWFGKAPKNAKRSRTVRKVEVTLARSFAIHGRRSNSASRIALRMPQRLARPST